MTNNSNPYLINNPFTSMLNVPLNNTLCLSQIDKFIPTKKFTDDNNTEWALVKASSDSTVDIPDPKNMQVIDYWNHEFPNLKTKVYVYVVEGIRQPRVETEQPTRIMYQWFSTVFVPNFTPTMITDKEWLKANVYAAPVINSRVSKLNAICRTNSDYHNGDNNDDKLIKIDELNDGNNSGNPE